MFLVASPQQKSVTMPPLDFTSSIEGATVSITYLLKCLGDIWLVMGSTRATTSAPASMYQADIFLAVSAQKSSTAFALSGYSIMSVRKLAPARWSASVKGPHIRPNIATSPPISSLSILVALSASPIRPLSLVISGSSLSSFVSSTWVATAGGLFFDHLSPQPSASASI